MPSSGEPLRSAEEILRYPNNELRGSEIIVGSVLKNHAVLVDIARPREIAG
jgi:hypothetical protein